MASHLASPSTKQPGAAGQYDFQANVIPAQKQQQYLYDHNHSGTQAMPGMVAAPPQYVTSSQHEHVHALTPQRPLGEAAWPGHAVGATSPGTSPAHPILQSHRQVNVVSSPQEVLQAYEPGALLLATSQLPVLSLELASHGLDSQAQDSTADLVQAPHGYEHSSPAAMQYVGARIPSTDSTRLTASDALRFEAPIQQYPPNSAVLASKKWLTVTQCTAMQQARTYYAVLKTESVCKFVLQDQRGHLNGRRHRCPLLSPLQRPVLRRRGTATRQHRHLQGAVGMG